MDLGSAQCADRPCRMAGVMDQGHQGGAEPRLSLTKLRPVRIGSGRHSVVGLDLRGRPLSRLGERAPLRAAGPFPHGNFMPIAPTSW